MERAVSPANSRWRTSVITRLQWITGLGLQAGPFNEETQSEPADWGWLPYLSLLAAVALLCLAAAGNANRRGTDGAVELYWLTLAIMYFFFAVRISWPAAPRSERLALIGALGIALYLAKVLVSPHGFSNFDEFIHWTTATDIVENQRLYTPNALLPISPLYPGLELVTTALSQVSGLPVFAAGTVVIGILRLVCLGAVFAIYENVTGSSRIACVGCLVYMGHSNFFGFHSGFAYESLAIAFLALALLVPVTKQMSSTESGSLPALLITSMLTGALAVTHHLTSYLAAALLTGFALLEMIRTNTPRSNYRALALATIAGAAAYAGFHTVGGTTASYLGPEVEGGLDGFLRLFTGTAPPRELFVSQSGIHLPLFMRIAGVGSAIILCAALAGGFFRTLHLAGFEPMRGLKALLRWDNSLLVLLTLMTLLFPIALLLRLSPMSWEVGNRLGSILFFGVAIVTATAIHLQWIGTNPTRLRIGIVGVLLTLVFLGGIVAGGAASAIPSRYKVAADAPSVEPMGIEAAIWTKTWLGAHHRIATDRTNRLLMALYGRQEIATTIQDGVDTTPLLVAQYMTSYELDLIKKAKLDYILVDLRLSQALPGVGVYFEKGEPSDVHQEPPATSALLKFNYNPEIGRPFDNGALKLFDVRALRD